jgi:hypothetical protein
MEENKIASLPNIKLAFGNRKYWISSRDEYNCGKIGSTNP